MDEPEEPGATQEDSVKPAAASEAGQRTEDAPSDDRDAAADTTQPPADQPGSESPAADDRPSEQSPAETTAPTSAGSGAQDPAVTDPAGEKQQVGGVEAGEAEAEVTSSQEPGTATAENTPGGSAASSQDSVEAKTSAQGEREEQMAGTEAEEAPDIDSAEDAAGRDNSDADTAEEGDKSDADTDAEEDNKTAEHSEEAEEKSEPSSTAEDQPDSAGSTSQEDGGRSLTQLVERSSLEQQHRALLLLRRQLLARSQRIQQRLSQHFSRKTDDATERVEKNVGELEARYSRYLSGIREQQRATAEERERRQQEVAAFRAQVEEQTEQVAAVYSGAVEMRRQVALKSRSGRTGRLMAAAELETLIGREQQKELEVQEARLESLRRETRLSRLEQTLRESEELAGGIHLIDFEQLKIENQTYAEKIEERNEDLTKLRRKISSTVQILTHLKERIQFEQAENERRQRHLQTMSADVTHGRESLAQLKQRRDQVRSRTAGQRATAGLLGHEALLRDFEARVDEEARLVRELQALKRDYADHQRMTRDIQQMVRTRRQQQGKHSAGDRQ